MNDFVSPSLNLPLIAPNQAQKHVTHNEALAMLDALVQLSVIDQRTEPPAYTSTDNNLRHLVAPQATGEFSNRSGEVAHWLDGNWAFYPPRVGWFLWLEDEQTWLRFDGTDWSQSHANRLGINATPDPTNRLAVASDAVLFNHDGGDLRLVLNKAQETGTVSTIFQSAGIARAELGLAGSNNLSIKTSSDGSSWRDVLTIDTTTGQIFKPDRVAFRVAGFPNTSAGNTISSFSRVDYNDGNAFNPSTGIFTAPYEGLFLFGWQFQSVAGSQSAVDLVVDGLPHHRVGREFNDTAWEGFSGTAFVKLQQGSTASLSVSFGEAHSLDWNGFCGVELN